MTGIHVLSNFSKVGSRMEKSTETKEQSSLDGSDGAAAVFTALLSGLTTSKANSKGQNAEVDSTSGETLKGIDSLPGYGDFALQMLAQASLQGCFPAGKEANSGINANQGTDGLTVGTANSASMTMTQNGTEDELGVTAFPAGNNVSVTLLDLGSLAANEAFVRTGMTPNAAQGNSPDITELDQYRQVISELLQALSGEINDVSPKDQRVNSETNSGTPQTQALVQEMAKIVQGWATSPGERMASVRGNDAQVKIQSLLNGMMTTDDAALNSTLKEKTAALMHALYQALKLGSDGLAGQPLEFVEKSRLTLPNGQQGNSGSPEAFPQTLKTNQTMPLSLQNQNQNGNQNADGNQNPYRNQNSNENGNNSNITNANVLYQVNSKQARSGAHEMTASLEPKVTKISSDQNSGTGSWNGNGIQSHHPLGFAADVTTGVMAEAKASPVTVGEQIVTAFREQVLNKLPQVKELDIQLHPADLGKVQIALRWENGQVHLQVQASEGATAQTLQNQLPELRHALSNAGINCGMFQMGLGGEAQQNSREDHPQRDLHSKRPSDDEADVSPNLDPLSLEQEGTTRINVTA